MKNPVASPDPPLARLHSITPTPMSIQRECRSANLPNTGAPSMYITMNAIESTPITVFSGLKPKWFWHQPSMALSVASVLPPSLPKNASLICGTTAASTWRSM